MAPASADRNTGNVNGMVAAMDAAGNSAYQACERADRRSVAHPEIAMAIAPPRPVISASRQPMSPMAMPCARMMNDGMKLPTP